MNRNNVLEKHILTRSYSSESQIEELLARRYSLRGDQKHFIHIVPTNTNDTAKASENILDKSSDVSEPNAKVTRQRKSNTRIELRAFIKTTLANQKKIVKKIQAYNRAAAKSTNPETPPKPFPITKMLDHYKIPKFEDFIPINDMWHKYIQNLLFPQQINNVPAANQFLQKIALADFNGCLLTVIESRNKNIIGLRGIVAWDTQHSFILCVPRDEDAKEWNQPDATYTPAEQVGGFRIISKKGTLFGFDITLPSKGGDMDVDEGYDPECIGFTVIGSRFEVRAVDRAGKKFKNHNVDDIL